MRNRRRLLVFLVGVLAVGGVLWVLWGHGKGPVTPVWQPHKGPELILQVGHPGWPIGTAFSPDGKLMATIGTEGLMKVWNPRTGELRRSTPVHAYPFAVTFLPDGKRIATACNDGTVKMWDESTGELIRSFTGIDGDVEALAVSPDGKSIAGGGRYQQILVWNTETGRVRKKLRIPDFDSAPDVNSLLPWRRGRGWSEGWVHCLAYSPDGSKLAGYDLESSSNDGTVRLWDIASGSSTMLATASNDPNLRVAAIAFTPDGRGLVCEDTTTTPCGALVLDVSTGTVKRRFGRFEQPSTGTARNFSVGGTLAAGQFGARNVAVWDTTTGKLQRKFTVDRRTITQVALSGRGDMLAVSSSWDASTTVFDVTSGRALTRLPGQDSGLYDVTWSPKGDRIAACEDEGVILWDVKTGKMHRTTGKIKGSVFSLCFSPDGGSIAAAGGEYERSGEIRVWDARTGETKWSARGRLPFRKVFYLQGGRLLAGHTEKRITLVCDAATGKPLPSPMVTATPIQGIGSSWIGTDKKSVVIVDAKTGRVQHTLPGAWEGGNALACTPDMKTIACGREYRGGRKGDRDSTIRLYDVRTGKLTRKLPASGRYVVWLRFSQDGSLLASGSKTFIFSGDRDAQIEVWDVRTGELIATMPGGGYSSMPVAFSPNNKTLACNIDGQIQLWDIRSMKLKATLATLPSLKRGADSEWISYTSEGYYVCSKSAEKFVRWRVGDRLYGAGDYRKQYSRADIVRGSLSK